MKILHSILFSAIATWILAGCASTASVSRPDDPVGGLHYDIDRILADSVFTQTMAAVKVVSLDNGEVLYDRNSDLLLRPASNMKLLTTSTALNILGPSYVFRTSILADSVDTGGNVQGNLILKGYGDPDFTDQDLDTLVWQLKASGIKAVTGNIVADASYFDDEYWGAGWMWDDEPYSFEASISALSIDKNCVHVVVIPGSYPGDSVKAYLEPATRYCSLLNTSRTVADTAVEPLTISRLYRDRLNVITVKGEAVAGTDTVDEYVTVWRPELYAANLLKERLESNGIAVTGQPVIGVAMPWAQELATHRWPIDSMMVNLNKVSDNLSAENTLKTISVMRGGIPGSAACGLYQVNTVMAGFGADTTSYYVVDGSGVSHYNLVTANLLIKILVGMHKRPGLFPLFYRSLPIAGVDGTLERRMRGTRAEGNVRAKTGSIGGVSSLSGYVTTLDGEHLAFSMLMQNFILPSRFYRSAQDSIAARLANFSRRSSFAQGP